MGIIEVMRDLMKGVVSNKKKRGMTIGIMIITCFFGLLIIYAFWAPVDAMKDVPVVVVNLDKGGTTADGDSVNFGDKIAENVTDNDSVKWKITNKNVFDDGIENTDYYFGFVIPENFTEEALSATKTTPTKAKITFVKNARKNFAMNMLSSNIKNGFSNSVSKAITRQYSKSTYDSMFNIKSGLSKAASGSASLVKGARSAQSGSAKLVSGADTLQSKVTLLTSGAGKLQSNVTRLSKGATQIKTGSDNLSSGATNLTSGLKSMQSGTDAGLAQYKGNVDKYVAAVTQLYNTLSKSPAWDSLSQTQKQQLAGLANNASAMDTGYTKMKTSIDSGFATTITGSQKLASGASQLSAGASSLSAGVGKLSSGVDSLASGSAKLAAGTSTLVTGANSMSAGMSKLVSGSARLESSLSTASGNISDRLVNSSTDMAEFISEPVSTTDDVYGDYDEYGKGLAPFFLSICLWIGMILIFLPIDYRPRGVVLYGRFSTVIGGYLGMAPFAVISALLTGTCALFIIGLSPVNTGMFLLWYCIAALTFLAVIHMLHIVFGPLVSKLLAILLFFFQIAAGGGIMAKDLLPGWLCALNKWLPMTYSIDGLRESILSGSWSGLASDVYAAVIFIAVSCIISLVCYRKTKTAGAPEVAAGAAA